MRSSRIAVTFAVTATLLTAPLFTTAQPASADATSTDVTVNTRAALATVPTTAVGVNHAVWDSYLGTNEVADTLHNAGVKMMRYPGGSYSDIYHWADNTAPGGYVAPNTDFDHFMSGVNRAGAQAIVIANYGTGSAQEAAGWVRYANVTKNYGVKYWEIGNENYGNGHYGSNWEADNHADKSPAGYANEVVAYADAMKAVDPTVKIGVVLTTPGNWPDGLVAGGDAGTWNQVVLSIAGPHVDFAILHWYPGGGSATEALSKTDQITDISWLARQQINQYAGKPLGIAITEMNTGWGLNTQPGALFAADAYAQLLENGVFTVDFWDVHNGPTTARVIAGQQDFEDLGLLSSGTCTSDNVCEPAVNTPFAPYYALQLLSRAAAPGDQLVRASSSDPLIGVHAARKANGDLAFLLLNRDPDNDRTVTLHYDGFTPAAGAPTVLTYTNGAASVTTANTGSAITQTLPKYSLTTIVVHPAALPSGQPFAPGQPVASNVTDTAATITWPAATGGTKYEIYRQNGTVSEQWGETTGTSFTVHNLVPGTRYTLNVVNRNNAGQVSWSSAPLNFQTGTPAAAPCAVKFADVNDWGNGYVANVDITNTGTTPIASWNLSFTWPTAWQSFGSGWSGNWSTSGRTVNVSNVDYNGALAPGATTSIGLVGNYSGPNVLPPRFTLNGQLCTTR